jgi:hypothetical protein
MKLILFILCFSTCREFNDLSKYGDAHHNIIEMDSIVIHGRVVGRIFGCEACNMRDTFPNPLFHPELRLK